MSTEIIFDKAQMSTNDGGVWLCLKLPFESRQAARDFVLKMKAEKKYRAELIKDIGGNHEVTPIKAEAVERWVKIWQGKGIGFIAEDLGESKIPGYHNIRNFYGSSTYDKAQMGRLLDMLIADCKENGIETLTPEDIHA